MSASRHLWIAFGLIACGGAAPESETTVPIEAPPATGPASATGGNEAHAMIGPAGGSLSLANGARLEIAPNLLAADTQVTLRAVGEARGFGDAEDQRPLGPVLAIAPALEMPACGGLCGSFAVSIPAQAIPRGFSESDLAFAVEVPAGDSSTETRWHNFPVRVENGRFISRLDALPGQRVQFGVSR